MDPLAMISERQSIKILRSNGRIHDAYITNVNKAYKFVSVEWLEGEEIKGKEIGFDEVLKLNREHFQKIKEARSDISLLENNGVSEVVSSSSSSPGPSTRLSKLPKEVKPGAAPGTGTGTGGGGGGGGHKHGRKNYHRETVGPAAIKQHGKAASLDQQAAVASAAASRNTTAAGAITGAAGAHHPPHHPPPPHPHPHRSSTVSDHAAPPVARQPKALVDVMSQESTSTSTSSSTTSSTASLSQLSRAKERKEQQQQQQQQQPPVALGKVRKSNCVKEVEKLKKNRDMRRLKQVEESTQKAKDYDVTAPNWEFLQKIQEYKAQLNMSPLRGNEPVTEKKICVCVRKRPLNKKEVSKKVVDVVTVPSKSTVLVHEPKTKVDLTKYLENQNFNFDFTFDETVSNEIVYRYTARPLVRTVFDGGVATCFAYGQTGSGKTHTMGGNFSGKEQDSTKGIYALAASDVFKLNSSVENRKKCLSISASFFEIYNGKVFDLLNKKKKLQIMEDGRAHVQVVGLKEVAVNGVSDVLQLISAGNICRTSGTTSANQFSSRSHAIFQIILRRKSGSQYGKFSLIDLAGNERGADTASADRRTRVEGSEINTSLLALKECIRALGRKGAHLPFRGSKLTLVLRDSFIGENSKLCMIAMVSPGFHCCEHTLNTMRYADRLKEIRSSNSSAGGDNPSVVVAAADTSVAGNEEEEQHQPVDLHLDVHPSNSAHIELDYLQKTLQDDYEEGGCALDRSAELLTFQEAVCTLMEAEEQLVETHKAAYREREVYMNEELKLIEYVESTECDTEEYANALEELCIRNMEATQKLHEQVQLLKKKLREEEIASKKLTQRSP